MAEDEGIASAGRRLPPSPYKKWQLEGGVLALTLYFAIWLDAIASWYVAGYTRMDSLAIWSEYLVRCSVNVGAVATTWCILSLLYVRRLDLKWTLAFGLSLFSWWGSIVVTATEFRLQK